MKVFWRESSLSKAEVDLFTETLQAHAICALRQNASTVAVLNTMLASGHYPAAVCAGLLSLGHTHGPVADAQRFIGHQIMPWEKAVSLAIESGRKIPGWGNSFEKGHPDPSWEKVASILIDSFPKLSDSVRKITDALHLAGKRIFPNAACYTAACNIAVGIPIEISEFIFLSGRLNVWSRLCLKGGV